MKRLIRFRFALAAVLAAVLTVVFVVVASGGALPANERAAQASARSMLASVTLPRGAKRSPGEPAGDDGALSRPAERLAQPDFPFPLQNSRVVPVGGWHVVDEDAFWTVDASLEAVVGDFTTGLPSGSIHGAAAVPRRVSLTASLELPAVANVLPIRRLVMTARRLADGKTGVRVDAQVAWIKPVLIVPKGTLLSIRITAPAGEGRPRSLTITSPREVRGVVALLNGLDRAARTGTGTGTGTGPSLGPCFGGYGIQVRLSFIGHIGDQPLARATLDAGCLGIMVKLTIDGHTEPTLNGYALEGSNDSQEALLLAQGLETELHLNLPPVLLTPWALDVPVNPSVQPAQLSGGR